MHATTGRELRGVDGCFMGGNMTVQETINMLEKFKNKNIQLYFDCRHCGHGMELIAAHEAVVVETRKLV
jgi:hypothetical protein